MFEFRLAPLLIVGDSPAARGVRAAGDEPLLATGVNPPREAEETAVVFPAATLVFPFMAEEVARRDATDRVRRGFFTNSLWRDVEVRGVVVAMGIWMSGVHASSR